jgi:hypothetical protein
MKVKEYEACFAYSKQVGGLAETLIFYHPKDREKVNPKLIADLICAAKLLGLESITISSAITGRRKLTSSGAVSRHAKGNAVDISKINGLSVTHPMGKSLADKLVRFLLTKGYRFNKENGHIKSVLWQSPGHYDHIHISRID